MGDGERRVSIGNTALGKRIKGIELKQELRASHKGYYQNQITGLSFQIDVESVKFVRDIT